jgi:hypothetical protein
VSAEYTFRITGRLTPTLIGVLHPLQVIAATTETLLVGHVTDRAELHGLTARIAAFDLDLVELRRLHPPPGDASDDSVCPCCHRSGAAGTAPGTRSQPRA